MNWNKFLLNSNLTNNQLMFTSRRRHRFVWICCHVNDRKYRGFSKQRHRRSSTGSAARKNRTISKVEISKLENVIFLFQLTFEWKVMTLYGFIFQCFGFSLLHSFNAEAQAHRPQKKCEVRGEEMK